jgi:hypothetical protein
MKSFNINVVFFQSWPTSYQPNVLPIGLMYTGRQDSAEYSMLKGSGQADKLKSHGLQLGEKLSFNTVALTLGTQKMPYGQGLGRVQSGQISYFLRSQLVKLITPAKFSM